MLGTLAFGSAVKSVAIPLALGAIRRAIPNYADPQCLMRLVNETANEHFAKHVYFRNVEYDESCAGQPLVEYVDAQFNALGAFENKLLKGFCSIAGLIGFVLLLGHLFRNFTFPVE